MSNDLPKSVGDFFFGWVEKSKHEITWGKSYENYDSQDLIQSNSSEDDSEVKGKKKKMNKNFWPVITAGAGLFSDGFVNNSTSTMSACLEGIYGEQYTQSNIISKVSAIAFAGTVCGMLVFGYISDYHSRKFGMLLATAIIILFAILCAGAWGVNTTGTNAGGLFSAITAYRFLLGIGIGGEYPTASVATSEASATFPAKHRNRWFVLFTLFMIDFGFVVSSFVPMVLLWICTPEHLQPVWRVSIGLGAVIPTSLFFLRLKWKESESFQKKNAKHARIPYGTVIKFYWFRLTVCALCWFLYDFTAYAFGSYSTLIIKSVAPNGDMYKTFGWNVVFNLFLIPGAFIGCWSNDYIGPRLTMAIGFFAQGILGFIIAGLYGPLSRHIAGFVVVYGIFLSLGEYGPGGSTIVLSARTCATPVRGQYFAIAAAVGKVGAFVGTYVFPTIQDQVGAAGPFWVSSAFSIFGALLCLMLLPDVGPEATQLEDEKFMAHLRATGFDISTLGDVNYTDPADERVIEDSKSKDQEVHIVEKSRY